MANHYIGRDGREYHDTESLFKANRLHNLTNSVFLADDRTKIFITEHLSKDCILEDLSQKDIDTAWQRALEELRNRNEFFRIMDGCEIPGSVYRMVENIDFNKIRDTRLPPKWNRGIRLIHDKASTFTVYSEVKNGFWGGRTLRGDVYVRGINSNEEFLEDSDCFHSFDVNRLAVDLAKDGTHIHRKLELQITALGIASLIGAKVNKPFKRLYDTGLFQYIAKSPARIIDFSASDEDLIGQVREALYITPIM